MSWFWKKDQFNNFHFAGETKPLVYFRSVHSPGKLRLRIKQPTDNSRVQFSQPSPAGISVTQAPSNGEMSPPGCLSKSRLKLELMLELDADTVALMESKICVFNASTRFQFSNSLNNVSVLNWVQFSSSFSLVSGQISGACQEAFTRNDRWDVSLRFLPG